MGTFKRYIPNKINEFLKKENHNFIKWNKDLSSNIYKLDYEGLVVIVDMILRIAGTKEVDKNHFVEISGIDFKNMLRSDYKLYLDYLIEERIIYTDNQYLVGEKSKSYKLNEDYLTLELDDVIFTNSIYNKRSINQINKKRKLGLKVSKHHKDTFEKTFKMDYDKSVEFMLYRYMNRIPDKKDRILDKYSYLTLLHKLKYIKDGQLYISRAKSNGRISSNLTCLNCDMKQFILGYDISLDIVSSQPTLLSLLIKLVKYIKGSNGKSDQANSLLSSLLSYDSQILEFSGFPNITANLEKIKLPSEKEIELWMNLCRDGNLYEYFQNEIYKKTGVKYKRHQVKEIVFMIMYSNPRLDNENKKLFNVIFPSIYKFMSDIKNLYKDKKSYRLLAIMLQCIESYVWVENILNSLDRMNIEYLFIHDSVIVKKEDADRVNLKITEIYYLFGIDVNVKVEKIKE